MSEQEGITTKTQRHKAVINALRAKRSYPCFVSLCLCGEPYFP
jgi:hypothetical protein